MKELLQELADSNRVLVTGSYARGEQTRFSDIDFFVKVPRDCVVYGTRNTNIVWLVELLARHGISWNSTRTSYISTIGEENNLPVQLEFYDGFYRTKDNRVPSVNIMGVTFKTY